MDASNTKTSIINKALSHLKQRNIASLAEQSEQARKAAQFYDCARKSALRSCDWHFARVQAYLTLLGDINTASANPVHLDTANIKYHDIIDQFNFTYLYPSNCVRLVKVYNPRHKIFPEPYGDRHTITSQLDRFALMRSPVTNKYAIGCNLERAKCHYTIDLKDESQFDDLFQDALGWQLADELCMPLTADKELQQLVHAGATEIFELAMRKNGGESPEMLPRVSPYESCRESGADWENHAL